MYIKDVLKFTVDKAHVVITNSNPNVQVCSIGKTKIKTFCSWNQRFLDKQIAILHISFILHVYFRYQFYTYISGINSTHIFQVSILHIYFRYQFYTYISGINSTRIFQVERSGEQELQHASYLSSSHGAGSRSSHSLHSSHSGRSLDSTLKVEVSIIA